MAKKSSKNNSDGSVKSHKFREFFIEEYDEDAERSRPAKKTEPAEEKEEKKEKKEKEPRKKHKGLGWLIFLLIIIIIAGGIYFYLNWDIHKVASDYRGTIIGDMYYFYIPDKEVIVGYSTSSGPHRYTAEDPKYSELLKQLNPEVLPEEYKKQKVDVVAEAYGEGFNKTSYSYLGEDGIYIVFSYPSNGKKAVWLYCEKLNEFKVLIEDSNIRPIVYGNGIIYARDEAEKATVCYRVSSSYSGQLISVQQFRTVVSTAPSFWARTLVDFANGLIKGLKAARD